MASFLPTFPPFAPATDSWIDYLERFDCFLLANDLTGLSPARSSCGSTVFATAKTLFAPQPIAEVPWDTLINRLKEHYAPAPSRVARRLAFRRRMQKDRESISDYVASLRTAALHCQFPELDDVLLDQLICGVRDLRIQRRLLSRKDLTFQAALDEAQATEAAEKSAAELRSFQANSGPIAPMLDVHCEISDRETSSGEEEDVRQLKLAQTRRKAAPIMQPQGVCVGCGGNHIRAECRFRAAVCRHCGKKGHISKVCRAALPDPVWKPDPSSYSRSSKMKPGRRGNWASEARDNEHSEVAITHATSISPCKKIYITVSLEGAPCQMEVDTGSSRSLIAWATVRKLVPSFSKSRLQPCSMTLKDYQGNIIPTLGVGSFGVTYDSFAGKLPLIVVRRNLPCLLGLDWFDALKLSISGVHTTGLEVPDVLAEEFADVFDGQLGNYKGTPISFNLDPQVAPIRLKARRVPLALRPKVDKELDKLIAQGILVPVDYSPWETPIVIPLKPDGSVRICADYKGTINKALQANPYPVPVVQHLLHSLGKAQTIVTHRGAFKCTRLQFGVCVAPGIFQCLMERLLHGLEGVVPYFDDVLISANDQLELVGKLRAVLTRLRKAGLKLKKEKCRIGVPKPLLGLLAGDRPTPPILSPRMSRWTEFLAVYSYHLIYKPGKAIGHADALSRCPLPYPIRDPAPTASVLLIEEWDSPISARDIRRETTRDTILSQVIDWVRRGWPKGPLSPEFVPYHSRQFELSVLQGCLLWGNRVVIPLVLNKTVLSCLHEAHPGVVRMKALGRSYTWWPKMDQEIERWVDQFSACQESRPVPPAATVQEWERPRGPWTRVHVDLAGPYIGWQFFILVDAYSKWVELALMPSTTSDAIIRVLNRLFATHGLPDTLVSDNGPQFTAAPFQFFLARLGIRHATTAPFHPAANGLAESREVGQRGARPFRAGRLAQESQPISFSSAHYPLPYFRIQPCRALNGPASPDST
ncbi:uncharacterized protein K02A2.6-like [Ahaetulla prasina]|uniref:uncharacterized protein K02A2.6-like n=1 Tax=Ahaetulla prasina TaxID=499056 RepID=UPI002647B130|nr:uncharacterized protein K02A2.6-like [Ahaetulla prasina]